MTAPGDSKDPQAEWEAQYNFWHRIISEEVERLRFNGGYEPVSVDLYPWSEKDGPAFLGRTQVGHVRFYATASWVKDQSARKILRIQICKAP